MGSTSDPLANRMHPFALLPNHMHRERHMGCCVPECLSASHHQVLVEELLIDRHRYIELSIVFGWRLNWRVWEGVAR